MPVTLTKDLEVMLSNPKVAILSMAAPLFVSYLITNLQTFADSFWCSGLGPDAMAAVSISAPMYGIIVNIGSGLGVGASAAIARSLGAGNKKRADSLASQVIMIILLISISLSIFLLICLKPLLGLMGGGEVMDYCMAYALPLVLFTFPLMMNHVVIGLLRSEGAAKRSMVLSILAAVLNLILDPVMIYGLNMGILGASLSTVTSYGIMISVGFYWYLKKKLYVNISFKGFHFIWEQIKDIFVVGVPRALELVVVSLLIIPQNVLVLICGGTEGMITYYYPLKFTALVAVSALSISAAMVPVTSAAIGQNDFEKAKVGFKYSFKMAVVIASIMAVVIFVLADPLTSVFCHTPETAHLHAEMTKALRIYTIFIPCSACVSISSGILQSLRLAQMSTVVMLIRELVLLGLLFIASTISMDAVYWSLTIALVLGGLMMIKCARFGIKRTERKLILSGA